MAHREGSPFGSVICRSSSATASISTWALLRLTCVNRCEFQSLSHNGWWALKSPSHTTCWLPLTALLLHRLVFIACTARLMPSWHTLSLYVLTITMLPRPVLTWTAVTSEDLQSICIHASVAMRLLTSISDLVLLGST